MGEVESLGEVAKKELAKKQPEQQHLDGTNMAKVTFVGMGWEPAEVPELKEEVEFVVKGTMVFEGEQVMADGAVRPVAKVKVEAVIRAENGTYVKAKAKSPDKK